MVLTRQAIIATRLKLHVAPTGRRGFGFQAEVFFFRASGSIRGGLRATEGYCLPTDRETSTAYPVIHALRDLYLLQLEQIHTQSYVILQESLDLGRHLLGSETVQTFEPLSSCLGSLLHQDSDLGLNPRVKGRFFDGMQRNLDNWIVPEVTN